MSIRNRTYLSQFIPVARGLQQYLGDMYEVILHDVSEPNASIVFIAGDLTHRTVGDPLTNVVIEEMKRHGDDAQDMIGYLSELPDGRHFKSSTVFLRDESGILRGCLCINMDISPYQSAIDVLSRAVSTMKPQNPEIFTRNITEVVDTIVTEQFRQTPVSPEDMTKTQRIAFISELERKGVFEVKGSVERVAQLLGISVFTVYSYLKEVQKD